MKSKLAKTLSRSRQSYKWKNSGARETNENNLLWVIHLEWTPSLPQSY